ncbi:MAG: hypothetical protein A3D35_01200 [Candidatus Staskawiczbacteria bacterium RIFCSPHIGHO2_02_FULL_34_9]|uniref:Prepilin-type N-terminal cleavage/methylation domain-containing protein n=1 Tax=Candidatus Staskawiczbacteria bacterium RIFCSPHIGHO2_02_FULL_34_9 TaxID=1802206 RepID=A0A1G2I1E3_9BACT|nr:MAG: hypothetical protein A3D35_01200 [Candidatus Staskawiczbacteria bacterium RIFCSPHIGHO2_02_FULL_34_9]
MIQQKGFTLIETLIYIFLFAIIIGGGMIATYNIIESTNASYNHVVLQEEANFIFSKVSWALTGADSVDPIIDPKTLKIKKTIPGNPTPTNFTFTLPDNENHLTIKRNSGPSINSNSDSVLVSNVSFERISGVGKPDAVKMNFTLTTLQNGRPATQDFSFIKYLRIKQY